jgi:CheY-like chemotaxis protein
MDGYEATEELRKVEIENNLRPTPIVGLTGKNKENRSN